MLFVAAYLFAVLVPGFLLSRVFKLTTQVYLYSISLSLAYFVAVLATSMYFGYSTETFYQIYAIGIAGLAGVVIYQRNPAPRVDAPLLAGGILVAVISAVYLAIVGMYDELPSDIFRHLEFFKQVNNQLSNGRFADILASQLLDKSARYWYHLPVLSARIAGLDFFNYLTVYASINNVLLLLAIYSFSVWLFRPVVSNPGQLVLTGLLSVFFFSAHTGIDTFSYLRYYAIAPTILTYSLYLTGVVALTSYYNCSLGFVRFGLLALPLFATALVVHTQEAMYMAALFVVLGIVLFFKVFANRLLTKQPAAQSWRDSVLVITPVVLVLAVALYYFSLGFFPADIITSKKLISLHALAGIGSDAVILNPWFQFYTVVTQWGGFIFLAYLLYYMRFFQNQPVLLAAMLAPLLTVFNPWFVEFFLRISSEHVLWRFLYMLPLPFVAARLVSGLFFTDKPGMVQKSLAVIVIGLSFILLLPIKGGGVNLPYSRIYTLLPAHEQARPAHWADMLEFLDDQPGEEIIITDPVTGYMVSALTRHKNRRYKFFSTWMRDPYEFSGYNKHPLKKYNGKLLVVNQRKGISTQNAKVSRHWHPDTLKMTEYYSPEFLAHIDSQPEHFKLLWEDDDIRIYRIKY